MKYFERLEHHLMSDEQQDDVAGDAVQTAARPTPVTDRHSDAVTGVDADGNATGLTQHGDDVFATGGL